MRQHAIKQASFKCSNDDHDLIVKIAERFEAMLDKFKINKPERSDLLMDITACHCSGNPLRLAELLAADDFNFSHDVSGIRHHIDRVTGELGGCFVPRFSKKD